MKQSIFREAEQMKYLYETLNQASLAGSNRYYQSKIERNLPLEPRRSNPLDRYPLSTYEDQFLLPKKKKFILLLLCLNRNSKLDYHTSDVHNQSYLETREQNSKKIQQFSSLFSSSFLSF